LDDREKKGSRVEYQGGGGGVGGVVGGGGVNAQEKEIICTKGKNQEMLLAPRPEAKSPKWKRVEEGSLHIFGGDSKKGFNHVGGENDSKQKVRGS